MKHLLYMILITSGLSAQVCTPEWQRSIGGAGYDYIYSTVTTADGGILSAGYTESGGASSTSYHGAGDAWLTRQDAAGNILWTRCFGGSGYDYAYSVIQTTDGGFVFCGYSESSDGDIVSSHGMGDIWLAKIDNAGTLLWSRCYGGTAADNAFDLVSDNAGGFVVCGNTSSVNGDITGNHGADDCVLLHTDQSGDLLWLHTYGGGSYDNAQTVIRTANGKYVLCGYTSSSDGDVSNSKGSGDAWILRTDASGILEWESSFGGSGYDFAQNVFETSSGNLLVTGYTESGDGDISGYKGNGDLLVLSLSGSGTLQWINTFGGSGNDYGYVIEGLSPASFLIAGYTDSHDGDVTLNHGDYDGWLLQLTYAGTLTAQHTFGGSATDIFYSLDTCAGGKLVTGGYSKSVNGDLSANMGLGDGWVMKLTPSVSSVPMTEQHNLIIRQGAEPLTAVISNLPDAAITELYNIEGKLISRSQSGQQVTLHAETTGTYLFRCSDKTGRLIEQGKLILR